MSNLKPLLEYQELDIALKRVRHEIGTHPDQAKFEKTRAEYNAARKIVAKNEEAAAKIVAYYHKILDGYKENEAKIEALLARLEAMSEDDEARKPLVVEIEAMRNRLASMEKRLGESKAEADNIIKSSMEARVRQKKLKEDAGVYSARAEKFRKEREPKIAELTAKLEQKRSEVDPKLMERYKRLSDENKNPPLVEVKVIDKSYYCYCGIVLSGSAKEELVDKGLCNCGHCGRMVYAKAKS